MKKLAVVVMVVAIATFMAAAMASADDRAGKKAIEGQYAFTGPGNCFVSPAGFDNNFAPIDPSLAFVTVAQIWEGVYTFKRDGTGTIASVTRSIDLPGALNIANISWVFNYTMTDSTRFTYKLAPGTFDTVEWIAGPNTRLGTNLSSKMRYLGEFMPGECAARPFFGPPSERPPGAP